jgi:hypothetical protein
MVDIPREGEDICVDVVVDCFFDLLFFFLSGAFTVLCANVPIALYTLTLTLIVKVTHQSATQHISILMMM